MATRWMHASWPRPGRRHGEWPSLDNSALSRFIFRVKSLPMVFADGLITARQLAQRP